MIESVKICPPFIALVAFVFSFLFLPNLAVGQEASGYHKFTPKVGNSIEAKLLRVSKDWKEMEIQKADGTSFSVAINLLSLDDQQFVKDWILLQPEKSDFELDVKITKETDGLERERYSSSTDLETRSLTYTVTVTNKSRETMEAPVVEYAVIYENNVRIYKASDGDWTYTTYSDPENRGITEKTTLPDLVYNRDQSLVTQPVAIHKVVGDGNVVYGEDDPQGVMVKISTTQGAMVGLYRSGESGVNQFTWEDAVKAAVEDDGTRKRNRVMEDDDEAAESFSLDLVKNVVVDGPTKAKARTIDLAATVEPSGNRSGVIIAVGGKLNGMAIYIDGGKVHLVQVVDNETKSVSATVPLGEFTVKGSLSDSLLSLTVGDSEPVTTPAHGLFKEDMNAGINVGEDVGTPLMRVGPYEGIFAFAGTIEDASIRFGDVEK